MSIVCVIFSYDNNDIFLDNYGLNDASSSAMTCSRIQRISNAIQSRKQVLQSLWNIKSTPQLQTKYTMRSIAQNASGRISNEVK